MISRFQMPVQSYLYHRLTEKSAAEDVLQEVFVRVWKHRGRYESRDSLAAWIFTIARNLALDHNDKTRRRRTEGIDAAQEPRSEAAGPERLAESSDMKTRIDAAIAALPEEQREVFLLREYGDITFAQIARETGCPLGTALARMRYAVLKLRESLGELDA